MLTGEPENIHRDEVIDQRPAGGIENGHPIAQVLEAPRMFEEHGELRPDGIRSQLLAFALPPRLRQKVRTNHGPPKQLDRHLKLAGKIRADGVDVQVVRNIRRMKNRPRPRCRRPPAPRSGLPHALA